MSVILGPQSGWPQEALRVLRQRRRVYERKANRICDHQRYLRSILQWGRARRVVSKVEWHVEQLFLRVNFIVTNLPWRTDRVVRFYNKRGMAEPWISWSQICRSDLFAQAGNRRR